jgi:hypothetical protein
MLLFYIGYLTWIGWCPIPTLHLGRLVLTLIPKIDPEYQKQVEYMVKILKVSPEHWKLGEFSISPEAWSIRYYSFFVIIAYLIVFLILDYLSGSRIACKIVIRGVTRLIESLKKAGLNLTKGILRFLTKILHSS